MFACWCPSTKRPGLFFSFLGYSRNKLWTHVVGGGGYGELWVIVNYTTFRIERGSSTRLRVLFRAAVFVHSRAGSCQKNMNREKKKLARREGLRWVTRQQREDKAAFVLLLFDAFIRLSLGAYAWKCLSKSPKRKVFDDARGCHNHNHRWVGE